jgi:chorismate mutase
MEKPITPLSLKELRSDIDALDRAMLELLEKRFAAIGLIRQWKQQRGDKASSPIRPAREAEILRRLEGLRGETVPPELMVRLWRSIMAAATAAQANVTIHASEESARDQTLRDLIRDHFAGLPVKQHASAREAVAACGANALDIAIVRTESEWIAPILQHEGLKVIGMLPILWNAKQAPKLLMLGQVEGEPTGDDETLVALKLAHEAPAGALWSANAGDWRCIALPGFLDEMSRELVAIRESAGDARLLGHCPSPLKVRR